MREIFDVFESAGIVSEDHISSISNLNSKDIRQLYERTYEIVFKAQTERVVPTGDELDPFTFFAGASIRGDTGCQGECRSEKLDFLGHYAALYANEVTVPLPLIHPDKLVDNDQSKELLSLSALTLLRLRPLVTPGIARPAVMVTAHCVHTIEWARSVDVLVQQRLMEIARGSMRDFRVVYQVPEKAPTGRSTAYIEGPRDFLEHGNIVMVFDEKENWRLKGWRYDSNGMVELGGSRKLGILRNLLAEISSTTSLYLVYGRLHKARLLTDLPGESVFLDSLTGNAELAATTTAMQYLTHSVPILGELSLATLMRIRREERDSFESYRSAITRITSEVLRRRRRLSKKGAQEMFKASIEPELARLRHEVRYERGRQKKRVAQGLLGIGAGIAIGAFGWLPVAVSTAIAGAAAVAGGRILGKAGEVACEHGANLRQQNDLYFLLRLEQEAQQ